MYMYMYMYQHLQQAYMYVWLYSLYLDNSETLCSNIVHVAERDAPTLVQQALVVTTKFRQAFSLFNVCHLTYDSKRVSW